MLFVGGERNRVDRAALRADGAADAAVADLDQNNQSYIPARARAGLAELDEAEAAATTRLCNLMETIAKTPAVSIGGVFVKVRCMADEIQYGRSEWGEDIAESALADIERLMGRA